MYIFTRNLLILFLLFLTDFSVVNGQVSMITGTTSICIGIATTLSDSTTGGKWSSVDAAIATIDSITGVVYGVTAGIDTIKYYLPGDTAIAIVTIDTVINPGVILSLKDSVCEADTIHVTDSVTGGTWSDANFNVFISSGIVTGVVAGPDTIRYTVGNSCGSFSAMKPITVLPIPVTGIITGSNICRGSTGVFLESSAGGTWSMSNNKATIDSTGSVTGFTAGLDTIVYTVTNSCGTQTATHPFSIDSPLKIPPVSGYNRVCVGGTDTLKDTVYGGSWTPVKGLVTVSSFDSGGVITGVNAGIDTIIYTVINSCGAYDTTYSIRVDTFPVVYPIIAYDSVCENASIVARDTVNPKLGFGVWSIANPNASISNAGLVHAFNAGTDTIIFTFTNSCGYAEAQKPVSINPLPNAGKISGPDTLCLGDSVIYIDTSASAKGTWNTGTMSPDSLSTEVLATDIGPLKITFTAKNLCGSKPVSKTVAVLIHPSGLITSGPKSICQNASIIVTNYVSGGIWSAKTGNVSVDAYSGIVKGLTIGTDTLVYTLANRCGSDSSLYPERVNPNPVMPVIAQKENLLSVDSVYTTYQWTLDGLPIPEATYDTYTVAAKGVYEIWVSNIYGCKVVSSFTDITAITPCKVSDLRIYPNPTSSLVYIQWCAYVNARLLTIEGKTILIKNHAKEIDLEELPKGIYMLYLVDDNGNRVMARVISKI